MADEQEAVRDNDSGPGFFGTIASMFGWAASKVGNAADAVMADGTIAAAGRQGLGELGEALKAFPDSIQVQEPGTIFNPTQGEIAADRADGIGRAMWPSEIAAQNRNQPTSDNGADYGKDTGFSM